MDEIYNRINRMKQNIEATKDLKESKKITKNEFNNKIYDEFMQKYKLGNVSQEQINQGLFYNVSRDKKLTFENCIKAAQTGGAFCNPGGKEEYCPYMAFKSFMGEDTGDCYIGGIQNDTTNFDSKEGIPVFPTPFASGESIENREKRTIEEIQKRLTEKKQSTEKELNQQITETQIYLKALNEGKSFEYAKEQLEKEKENREWQNKIQKKKQAMQQLENQKKIVSEKEKNLGEILSEKEKREKMEEEEINKQYQNLGNLDKLLFMLRQKISFNNDLYTLNEDINYYLKISLIIIILFVISVFVYYSIKKGYLDNVRKMVPKIDLGGEN